MSEENVLSFPLHRVTRTKDPVPMVCEVAGETFKDIIIMGENQGVIWSICAGMGTLYALQFLLPNL